VERRVAFVTGASRGIGAAASIALAEHGFDVAVTARTVHEGATADGRPLPGSLDTTAEAVRTRGREALPLRLDLLEPASIAEAVEDTLARWGRIDVLLNNGIYTGPGSMDLFLDLDPDTVHTMFRANLFAQIDVTQRVLPGMLERGSGVAIDMVSARAFRIHRRRRTAEAGGSRTRPPRRPSIAWPACWPSSTQAAACASTTSSRAS